jgi:uncharacterized membrane protein
MLIVLKKKTTDLAFFWLTEVACLEQPRVQGYISVLSLSTSLAIHSMYLFLKTSLAVFIACFQTSMVSLHEREDFYDMKYCRF